MIQILSELKTVPTDLNKLSTVVDNDVVKQSYMMCFLQKSVLSLLANQFIKHNKDDQKMILKILKIKYLIFLGYLLFHSLIQRLVMLPDLSNLFAITKLNAKATKIKNKISSITCLVITDAVNTKVTEAENKIPDFSGSVKKQILTQN